MTFPTLSYDDADGRHDFVLDQDSISIGRLPDQNIVLRAPRISRQHAMIVREGQGYVVVDRNSSHGTFLNGVRVTRAELRHGDSLQLGAPEGQPLVFTLPGESARTVTTQLDSMNTLLSSISQFPQPDEKAPVGAREMGQLSWLLNAARQLNAGGGIEEILTSLLQLTLQLTGVERGFVFLRVGGNMKLARGLNSAGQLLVEDSTISRRAMLKAIESDAKFSISDALADDKAAAWASVMTNRIRSIYCIPLRKRDAKSSNAELLGLLYLDSQIGAGHLSEVDHQLLDTIATEAAALLQNALLAEEEAKSRRAREELAVAATIHSGLMAIDMPVIAYARIKARSVPCYEIGGDFFDVLALDDCVCVAIADVSGKGVPAAIVAATMQGIIHAQLLSGQSLPNIASLLNRFLCSRNVGKYATMVLLKLFHDGRVEYLNCGHIAPLVVASSGTRWLEEGNLIVGIIPNAAYASAHFTANPGERILLATDGLLEAENSAGEPLGNARFAATAPHLDLNGILDHVAGFRAPNQAQDDDCTLVEVVYTGA